ncbi:MAG: adenylosuccinate lyase [Actinobacteria bacterium]|nr:adenylosuccinate lyase [Actinomycetota bacterium]
MIPRYSLPEMAKIFSDEERFSLWTDIELEAVSGWANIGVVPEEVVKELKEHRPLIDQDFIQAVENREAVTKHDVAAFVDVLQQRMGTQAASWIHYGLTSSDVVDTALSVSLVRAADLLIAASTELIKALKERALSFANLAMVGRTHGMHAEPITFGGKLALFCLQVGRDRQRLRNAREMVRVGKLSGAVGTYSNIDPAVEEYVCRKLGLDPVPANQVISRDRHAEYLFACASSAATVELIATEIRHLQRSEVGEVAEPFFSGQKGSSAMPHKRNPVNSERLCGLARLVRGYLSTGLEDVALWHERDISHSSVERMILPDASMITYFMLRQATQIIEGLEVYPERMAANLDASKGMIFSQSVLLELVEKGIPRDEAYRIVQEDSMVAMREGSTLKEKLAEDKRVNLTEQELDRAFSLERVLRHSRRSLDALSSLED